MPVLINKGQTINGISVPAGFAIFGLDKDTEDKLKQGGGGQTVNLAVLGDADAAAVKGMVSKAGISGAKPRVKVRALDSGAKITATFPVAPASVSVTNAAGTVTYPAAWDGASTVTVSGLANGTAYGLRVVAAYASGSVASEVASVTPAAAIAGINPTFWLAARLMTGFSNGSSVTTATDQSGNGWALRGGSNAIARFYGQAAADPTYVTGAVNGQPAIAFSGAAGTSAQYLWTNLRPLDLSAQCTIFIVGKAAAQNASSKYKQFFLDTTPAQAQTSNEWLNVTAAYSETAAIRGGSAGNALNCINAWNDQNSGAVPPAVAIVPGAWFIGSITLPGTVYVNGAQYPISLANSVGTNILRAHAQRRVNANGNFSWVDGAQHDLLNVAANFGGSFTVGTTAQGAGANNLSGQIAELLIFDRALSQAERWAVEAALSTIYGVSVVQQ